MLVTKDLCLTRVGMSVQQSLLCNWKLSATEASTMHTLAERDTRQACKATSFYLGSYVWYSADRRYLNVVLTGNAVSDQLAEA